MIDKIAVIGDGGWGTTLSILLSKKGYKVRLWSPFQEYAEYLDTKRENTKFLPDIKIPEDIFISSSLIDVLKETSLIVLAVPSKYLRQVLTSFPELDFKEAKFLSVIKGIECNPLLRMSELIKEILGDINLAVLSGPSIATEVARDIPTSVVVSSKHEETAKIIQSIFSTDRFRVYTSKDIIGIELGGALKNIIAVACGIADGLGFGTNSKAALVTRGLAEISRLGVAMGADVYTFMGLSGMGDLITTCFSPYSRNRFVGDQIGKGKSLKDILTKMDMVAEGVETVKSAKELSEKYNIEMPITNEVYQVLYENKDPCLAVSSLMKRGLKEEF